jgi:hypothetical protein
MKAESGLVESAPIAEGESIRVTILCDDCVSRVRAKCFTEQLAESFGLACRLFEHIWRSDSLISPAAVEAATLAAAECDYFVVSLRGDRPFPVAAHEWIEAELERASAREAGVIVLADSLDANEHRVLDACERLRSACALQHVAFASYWVSAAAVDHLTSFRKDEAAAELGETAGSGFFDQMDQQAPGKRPVVDEAPETSGE